MDPFILHISISKSHLGIGEETSVDILLSSAPKGISGFDIELILEDGSIAEFVDVDFPRFGLFTALLLPSDSVRLRALDLNDIVPYESENTLLVSVSVRGKSPGTITIIPTVNGIDDDAGDPIDALVMPTSLTVLPGIT